MKPHLVLLLALLLSTFTQAADLLPPPMDTMYANHLQAESSQFISVNLFGVEIDPSKAKDPANYTITSADDAAYASGKQPKAAGSRTRAERVALRKDLLTKGTHIFLQLPTPMQNGKSYSVKVANLGELPALPPVLFDDGRQINDNIRLNQLGFLPDRNKVAYLGQYMGDAGPMPFEASEFHLIDAAGKKVFTGKPARREANEQLVGQQVWEMDFTALNTPGTYRVQVPGVGVSYDFVIGANALNPMFVTYMRGHYHQRCGCAVEAAFSRHAREACHLDDAYIDIESTKTKFTNPKKPPLYEATYDGRQQKAIHGHHDAGDYGKYTVTGGAYVFATLNAMDAFPAKFRDDNVGLPNSGNGVPDLLEETKWELEWLENMQDASDGGVFGVIRPRSGGYEHALPAKEAKRLFFPKDTVHTGSFAAAMARAARSADVQKYYPEDAKRYLTKAVKAWEFLEKNDRFVEYFHYGANFGDTDERAWAAVELYAATGKAKYHEYFLKKFDPGEKRWGWWGLFENSGHAVHTYLGIKDRQRDPSMVDRCTAALKEACEQHVRFSNEFPYRLSMPEPSINHKSYGWYFPGDMSGYDLLMGYAVLKDEKYLQCALDNMSYTAGANASGHFLMTGLGQKRNIEVVSDYANNDNIIDPIPGIPLGIGSAGFYHIDKYGPKIGAGTYPAETWPLVNRWYDGFNVTSEFTMGPMMRETIVAAYFADLREAPKAKPTVKIVAKPAAGPAPLAVSFAVETSRPARQVFWDFGDESFSSSPNPQHVFTGDGQQYPVAVSIIDANGLWAYDQITVSCTLDKVNFSRAEHKADAETVALYHLNGDLKDASGKAGELTVETRRTDRQKFKFAPEAPMWMDPAKGSCLVLDGAEHFTIPLPEVKEPATTPITVEMMVYVKEFVGWGYEGNPALLGLKNDWDSQLSWSQDTWDKANAPSFGDADAAKFAKDFPRDRWCHVKLTNDGSRQVLYVDGKPFATKADPAFKETVKAPLVLSFGPFRGMVDEVRVRIGSD